MKKIISFILVSAMLILNMFYCSATENNVVYYVDSAVEINGDGSITAPFKSISKALNKAYLKENCTSVTVILRGGRYQMVDKLSVKGNKGNGVKVTVKSYEGEEAEITGSVLIDYNSANAITDTTVYSLLPLSSRDKIVAIDLKSYNIDDYGVFSVEGNKNKVASQLYYNGKPLTVSRYPNFDYDKFTSISVTDNETSVAYSNFNECWRAEKNALITYYETLGYVSYNKTVNFDKAENKFSVSDAAQLSNEGRFYLWNMLSEIDLPGEYYIDTENNVLYLYPPFGTLDKSLELSVVKNPLVELNMTNNVTLENLIITGGASDGLNINKCNNVSIKNCVIKNFTGNGININNCTNVKVENCDIFNLGFSGVWILGGGDYKTFKPSGIEIVNNDIYNFAIYSKANGGNAIMMDNTGYCVKPKVKNNRIHNAPCVAIYYKGSVEPYIGYNEIYNVCREVLDNGALYAGRTSLLRNTVVENNFFHDLKKYKNASSGTAPIYGIYADDYLNAVTSRNNIFYKCDYPIIMGGGSDHIIENNLFIDCNNSIKFDDRGLDWAKDNVIPDYASSLGDIADYDINNGIFTWKNEIWKNEYPQIESLFDLDKVGVPLRNKVTNNMLLNTGSVNIFSNVKNNATDISNNQNFTSGYSFVDKDNLNLTLNETSSVLSEMPEFQNIDTSKIGLTRESENNGFYLMYPQNYQSGVDTENTIFMWEKCNGVDAYKITVARDENFNNIDICEEVFDSYYSTSSLDSDVSQYFWKVETVKKSKDDSVVMSLSGVNTFTPSDTPITPDAPSAPDTPNIPTTSVNPDTPESPNIIDYTLTDLDLSKSKVMFSKNETSKMAVLAVFEKTPDDFNTDIIRMDISDNSNLSYLNSNEYCFSVDEKGNITAKEYGFTTVEVCYKSNNTTFTKKIQLFCQEPEGRHIENDSIAGDNYSSIGKEVDDPMGLVYTYDDTEGIYAFDTEKVVQTSANRDFGNGKTFGTLWFWTGVEEKVRGYFYVQMATNNPQINFRHDNNNKYYLFVDNYDAKGIIGTRKKGWQQLTYFVVENKEDTTKYDFELYLNGEYVTTYTYSKTQGIASIVRLYNGNYYKSLYSGTYKEAVPTIIPLNISNGATEISVHTDVKFEFSHTPTVSGRIEDLITVNDNVKFTASITDKILTIDFTKELIPNKEYTVTLKLDKFTANGNNFTGDTTLTFTTEKSMQQKWGTGYKVVKGSVIMPAISEDLNSGTEITNDGNKIIYTKKSGYQGKITNNILAFNTEENADKYILKYKMKLNAQTSEDSKKFYWLGGGPNALRWGSTNGEGDIQPWMYKSDGSYGNWTSRGNLENYINKEIDVYYEIHTKQAEGVNSKLSWSIDSVQDAKLSFETVNYKDLTAFDGLILGFNSGEVTNDISFELYDFEVYSLTKTTENAFLNLTSVTDGTNVVYNANALKGKTATVVYEFTNLKLGDTQGYTVIIAVYDKVTNKLLGINYDSCDAIENLFSASGSISVNISDSENDIVLYSFVWNSTHSMKPIINKSSVFHN